MLTLSIKSIKGIRSMEKVTFISAMPRGMKCDNPECDWKDIYVRFENYEEYIDRPCPKCGSNLLTRECYERACAGIQTAERINDFLNKVMPKFVKRKVGKSMSILHADVDSDGRITKIQ